MEDSPENFLHNKEERDVNRVIIAKMMNLLRFIQSAIPNTERTRAIALLKISIGRLEMELYFETNQSKSKDILKR